MWSFLSSSIRVRMLLVGICSFLAPVSVGWRWISRTRIHVFHHGLAFSNMIFFVLFWVKRCVFPRLDLLRVVLILLSYYLSIRVFFVMFCRLPYFSLKLPDFSCIRLLVCFPVISLHLLVEFLFVVLELPLLSVFFYPLSISFKYSYFHQYILVYFFILYCDFSLRCLFLFVSTCSSNFPWYYHLGLFS